MLFFLVNYEVYDYDVILISSWR